MQTMHRSRSQGGGGLAVFGLLFVLVGLALVASSFFVLQRYRDSATWERIPMTIEEAELISRRSRSGSNGGYTTVYHVRASYSYEYGGFDYRGNRVGLETGSSSARDFHQRQLQELRAVKMRDEPWLGYVNPADPSDSFLIRELSPGYYIFTGVGLLFAGIGLMLVVKGILGMRTQADRQARLARHPERPWLAESIWDGHTLVCSSGSNLITLWGFGIGLCVFSSLFLIAIRGDSSAPLFAMAIVGLFWLGSVAMIISAIYKTMQHVKYGTVRFRMDQLPFVPGGSLSGRVEIDRSIDPFDGFTSTLTCREQVSHGRDTRTNVLYTDEQTIPRCSCELKPFSSTIPVSFQLPSHAPLRDQLSSYRSVQWSLTVHAATPGVDFSVNFDDLPVFRVEDPNLVEPAGHF